MRPASHMGRAAALIKGTVPTYSARGATVKRPWVMSELPYRPGVGVMLLNRQRHVFVGQRIDSTAAAWRMTQGGIDKGGEQSGRASCRDRGGQDVKCQVGAVVVKKK